MTASFLPDRLPDGWRGARLRWVSRIYAGGTPSRERPDYWHEGTIPWLNSGAVNDWAINEPSEYITGAGLAGSSARWIPPSSVVMALAGQGKTKGTAARLEIETTCNQSMAALVPGQTLDYRFLHFWLVANYERVRNLGGGDLRDGLNLQMVGDIEIPLPPVEEQRRIADFLDDQVARIDELKGLRHQQYELTREGFASWLDSQTDEMPLVPLRRLASSITSGPRGWGDLVSDEGDRMFIRINNISAAGIGMNPDDVAWVTPEENAESRRARLEKGDLLVSITASIGDVSTVDSPIAGSAFSQHVARVRLVDPSRGRDVAWAASTSASRERLRSLSFGGTKVGLGLRDVLDWEIPLVPDDAARTFSALTDERFELVKNASTALETGLALLEERKRALITAAVTGEMDVTTARPIDMGRWVPGVGADVSSPAIGTAPSLGGI